MPGAQRVRAEATRMAMRSSASRWTVGSALRNVAAARLAISHGPTSVAWGRGLLPFHIPIPVRCSVFVLFRGVFPANRQQMQ